MKGGMGLQGGMRRDPFGMFQKHSVDFWEFHRIDLASPLRATWWPHEGQKFCPPFLMSPSAPSKDRTAGLPVPFSFFTTRLTLHAVIQTRPFENISQPEKKQKNKTKNASKDNNRNGYEI